MVIIVAGYFTRSAFDVNTRTAQNLFCTGAAALL